MSSYPYYVKGVKAYQEGKDFWECPYCSSGDLVSAFPAWLAGWCWAKQQEKNEKRSD